MVIAGIVVMVLGLLMVVGGYVFSSATNNIAVPAGSVDTITPSGLGPTTFTVSWSGGTNSTHVYLITGGATCTGAPSGIVAQGTGASGTFSATLTSGTAYGLYACAGGSPAGLTFSYTAFGLTYLMLIGIVLVVIGLVIGFLGLRAKPKNVYMPPPMEQPPAP